MVEIRRIKFREAAEHPDFDALLEEYGDEAGMYGMPRPNCQVDMYDKMQDAGIIHVVGAFKQDRLVGVIVIVVSVIPHYGVAMATTESFFVRPAERKTGAGLMLLKEAEALSAEYGAFGLLVSAPFGGKLAEVLPNKGYTETNRVFFRRLS
tara:strand:- start:384 stop:836 length:453 start_codon:yes stop_codon:yes gene_type:complete